MSDIAASFVLMGLGWGATFVVLLLFYVIVIALMKFIPDDPETEADD